MARSNQLVSADDIGLPRNAVADLRATLRAEPRIERAILYGSRAKGNYRPGSDLDLCLVAPDIHLADLWALDERIDDLLLPWKVDLQLRHLIDNPDLLAHIERVSRLFYAGRFQT